MNGHLLRKEPMADFLISDKSLYERTSFEKRKKKTEYDFWYEVIDNTILEENFQKKFKVKELNEYSKNREELKLKMKYLLNELKYLKKKNIVYTNLSIKKILEENNNLKNLKTLKLNNKFIILNITNKDLEYIKNNLEVILKNIKKYKDNILRINLTFENKNELKENKDYFIKIRNVFKGIKKYQIYFTKIENDYSIYNPKI